MSRWWTRRRGQDLTRVTLTQIITEDAREKPTGLPLELLRQLIVASDEVRQEFIMWYLKSAFDTYHTVQNAVQNRLGEVRSAILSPVDMMKRFLAAPPPNTEGQEELDMLRRRVAELEARLEKVRRANGGNPQATKLATTPLKCATVTVAKSRSIIPRPYQPASSTSP